MALYTVSVNNPVSGGNQTIVCRSYSDFQAAIQLQHKWWSIFQNAAKTALDNINDDAIDTPWTTYGSKVTGTTPPSVPATVETTEILGSVCGAFSSQSLLTGEVTIGTKFFSSGEAKRDKRVEYRLKEIKPYIAPGTTWYGLQTVAWMTDPNYLKAVANIASLSSYSVTNGPGLLYLFHTGGNGSVLTIEAALRALNNTYVYSYNPLDVRNKWNYNGLFGSIFFIYNSSGSSYSFSYFSYITPRQSGEWEIETRTTYTNKRTSQGALCKTSSYVATTLDKWEDMGGGGSGLPGPITVRLSGIVNPDPLGLRNSKIVHIGNICGSTTPVTAYNPYEIDSDPIPGYNKAGKYHPAVEFTYTTPGHNFLVQQGDPFSSYSETKGMYVFDLYYKKWGKCKQIFGTLIDLTPMNIAAASSPATTDIGMNAAVLKDSKIRLFDTEPTDSMIRYGKIGYIRLGVTHLLEEHLHFKRDFYGSITIEPSLDGRNIDLPTIHTNTFFGTKHAILYPNIRYKWHNVVITGVYDMNYLETRGNVSGRR